MGFDDNLHEAIYDIMEGLSPEDEKFDISSVGENASEEEKELQKEYILRCIQDYAEFQAMLSRVPKLKKALESIFKVIKDYGYDIRDREVKPYMSLEKDGDEYYIEYDIYGPNSLGDVVHLFDLRINMNNNKILEIETFSYDVDGGATWDSWEIIHDMNYTESWNNFKKDGYDLSQVKKYADNTLNKLSLHCAIFPQIQNDQSMSSGAMENKKVMKHKELLKKQDYGYYKVRTDMLTDGAWIEASSGTDALEKSEVHGDNPVLLQYVTPEQAREEWKSGDYVR